MCFYGPNSGRLISLCCFLWFVLLHLELRISPQKHNVMHKQALFCTVWQFCTCGLKITGQLHVLPPLTVRLPSAELDSPELKLSRYIAFWFNFQSGHPRQEAHRWGGDTPQSGNIHGFLPCQMPRNAKNQKQKPSETCFFWTLDFGEAHWSSPKSWLEERTDRLYSGFQAIWTAQERNRSQEWLEWHGMAWNGSTCSW